MMSPGTAHASLKLNSPFVASTPRPRRPARPRLLAEHPKADEILGLVHGADLGPMAITIPFSRAPFTAIAANSYQVFEDLVIITGRSELLVSDADERRFLTGNKGLQNDCLILFRHAYGKVICDLSTSNLGADTHVGFLTHTHFREAWHADFARQPSPRIPTRTDWTPLPCTRTELNELQGIAWRGGTLCIEQITLEP
jgi:hypothetical protein